MYRFRSFENLLTEHQELVNQEIYFATPNELNDPTARERSVEWRGSVVAWRNLLRHYLLCLYHTALLPEDSEEFAIPLFQGEASLDVHTAFEKIEVSFFVQKIVAELIHVLASKQAAVKKDEMLFYLKCIHNTAVGVIAKALERDTKALQERANGFEKAYFSEIAKLMHPQWFAACFLENCTSAAVWECYGEAHRGVCLKFKDKEIYGQKTLPLTWQEEQYDEPEQEQEAEYYNHTLRRVHYGDDTFAMNFFDAMGELPLPDVVAQWFQGGDGPSKEAMLNAGFNAWVKNYWQHFERSVTTKPTQWAMDKEYRIIMSEHFLDGCSQAERTFKYDFNDLEAVIFGAQTPDLVRVEIIDILERKCNEAGRKSFDFYQAKVTPGKDEVELIKLDLVQSMIEL